MSLDHAFFYKSVNNDRVYDDLSFEHWLKKFFTSGVFLNDLQVTANDDMTVKVGTGYTNIDGKVKIFASESSLIIETAGASYPRIDSIVLERNDTERDILLKVVKGGYSSEPVAHTPVRQDGVYQLVIAQVLVNSGAVKVTQANITDTRSNTELCGIVAGAVEQIDFSQVQAQFDSYFSQYKKQIATDYTQYNEDMESYLDQMAADFSAWFEGIRNQLDEDTAGHLQNQIDDINERLEYAGGSNVEVSVDAGKYNVEGLEVNLVIDGKTYTSAVSSENVAKFTGILEVGTSVITCVDETQEFNAGTSIEIPYYGAYECSIKPSGSYTEWIEAGGLNPSSYESLEVLLEDEKAIRTLMTKKDSVDVLARMSGSNLATIINHPYVAKWTNYREYAYSTLYAISNIKNIMDASGMYGMYITVESDGTWKPKGLVPVMTSNTAPYGEALTNSTFSSTFGAYNVFNEGITNGWIPSAGVKNIYLAYRFVNPTIVKKYSVVINKSNSPSDATIEFKASNNGVDWVPLDTFTTTSGTTERVIENNTPYLYYGIHSATELAKEGLGNWEVKALQFYGRQLEALVPPMTSNTAPYGEAFASSLNGTYYHYLAFDGDNSTLAATNETSITENGSYYGYKFAKPTTVKAIKLNARERLHTFKIQASNDNSDWKDISDVLNYASGTTVTSGGDKYYNVTPTTALYFRIVYVSANDSRPNTAGVYEIQLYGIPDYESRSYIYDNGVEVMEVTTSGTVTKNADCITLATANSTATATLDTTSNKVLYGIAGMNATGTNALVCGSGSSTFTANTMPKNTLDITSINGSNAVGIKQTAVGKFDCEAIWIE